MREARFYKLLDKSLIQCQLCSHFCAIKKGDTGKCGVRKNIDGKLHSIVYGRPVALNIDPIEKKPLFHFFPGTLSYSLGTLGCNFKCANCQNWDISQEKNIEKISQNIEYISPEKIVEEAMGNDCKSISYTYNEPTIWTEYALDIMRLAHDYNLKNIFVSNGFMSNDCIEAILPYLDAINIDLKSFDDEFYKNNCAARVKPILKNLKTFYNEQVHLEITTLVLPSLSDDFDMLKNIAEFIADELDINVPWHISRFTPQISWKLKKSEETPEESIYNAYEIGKEAGLKFIYTGNLHGDQKENTFCPNCKELAISRLDYQIERLDNHGRCSKCDKSLDIIE